MVSVRIFATRYHIHIFNIIYLISVNKYCPQTPLGIVHLLSRMHSTSPNWVSSISPYQLFRIVCSNHKYAKICTQVCLSAKQYLVNLSRMYSKWCEFYKENGNIFYLICLSHAMSCSSLVWYCKADIWRLNDFASESDHFTATLGCRPYVLHRA